MDKKLIEYIQYIKETIKLISNQEHIEKWAIKEFLSDLNVAFKENELIKSSVEPIDIQFHEANFQIKTIYDENRKMIEEYKSDLKKAESASTLTEALQLNLRKYSPQYISIQEIADLISKKLQKYILSPEQYKKIDMVFYFNRWHHYITKNVRFLFRMKRYGKNGVLSLW